MQDPGDPALAVEAQSFLGASGGQMEVAAHRPEEALGALEPAIFLRTQQSAFDHLGRTFDSEQMIRDPV